MIKLLVDTPSGAQGIMAIGDGGGYFDPARVLWDERDDGPMPEITLGGMVRVGDGLVYSQERMDEHIEASKPPVPQSVSRAQGKAALIQAGLWSAVVAYVDAMTDPTEKALAEVALNDTTEWLRTSPFLNAAATALGLTETQLDDLFRTAATIQL